jgi:pyruvate dehydrogenase phosphatase
MARTSARRVLRTAIQHDHATKRLYSSRPLSLADKVLSGLITGLTGIALIWWLENTITVEDAPVLKSDWIQQVLNRADNVGIREDAITRMLCREAYSFPVKDMPGVSRYYGAQLASNSPCEDRYVHGKLLSPRNDGKFWLALAVFDGHAGWQTADLLEKQLLSRVQDSFTQMKCDALEPSTEITQRAIAKAFLDLDSSIMDTAREISQSERPLQ